MNRFHALLILALLLNCPAGLYGYSVLSHEAVIDTAWEKSLQPLLLQRFPNLTPDQLLEAHAYAYGGCIIQDLGYYPFGSKLFSDLVHYVRSGDFVAALLRDAADADQYAFALGGLAHYAADNNGHPLAVNVSVPLLFPKLRRKYGDSITYAENPAAHLKTEFGFDVVQVAKGHYAPKVYHDFIGFQVSKPLLERAFHETYSLEIKDVCRDLDLSLGTYRYSVSSVIPTMTKAAWAAKKDEIVRDMPGMTRRKYIYNISRASYNKEWGPKYERPGILARFLAFIFRVIPKIGPFRTLAFKPPTPETERLFMKSFNVTLDHYRALVDEVKNNQLQFVNENLDVGKPTRAGGYPMADKAYARLLEKLASNQFSGVTPELRTDILSYYADLNAPIETKKHKTEWKKVLAELNTLKSAAAGATE